MNPFQIGDVVYLKSGSYPMTVSTIDGEMCQVTWQDSEGKTRYRRFHYLTLTKENPIQPLDSGQPQKIGF